MLHRLTLIVLLITAAVCAACERGEDRHATAPPAQQRAGAVIPAKTGIVHSDFTVEGMHCADCTAAIRGKLTKMDGVIGVDANWKAGLVKVVYDPQKVQDTALKAAIEELKFKVVSLPSPQPIQGPAGAAGAQGSPPVISAAGAPQIKGIAGKRAPAGARPPALPPHARLVAPEGQLRIGYKVEGIKTSATEVKLTKGVAALKGVSHVRASHLSGTVTVDYDPKLVTPEQIEAKLKELGFPPVAKSPMPSGGKVAGKGTSTTKGTKDAK
jgi:copper ion binding protein